MPDSTVLRRVNHFARRHEFFTEQSFNKYTTSQRRTFERDVYDYARSIALSKAQAKASIIHARGLCGEINYNSDDSRLDDDEIDDSAAPSVGLPASTSQTSPATRTQPPLDLRPSTQISAAGNGNARKRSSDTWDDRSEKRRKADEDTATEEQPKTQEKKVVVTWVEIKGRLLASFENATLQCRDKQTTDSLKEKILESIKYAARLLDLEEMEGRPSLLESFAETFESVALKFFAPVSNRVVTNGRNLRRVLNANLNKAMAQRKERKQHQGRQSVQHSERLVNQPGNNSTDQALLPDQGPSPKVNGEPDPPSASPGILNACSISEAKHKAEDASMVTENSDTSARSKDSGTESDARVDNARDQSLTARAHDSTAVPQPQKDGDEGAEVRLHVIEAAAAEKDTEKKVVELVQELSQKCSAEQLTDETKTLLRRAFEAYKKHNVIKDSTKDDRLLRERWASLIYHGTAYVEERPGANHELVRISGQDPDGRSPFEKYSKMDNAWQPLALAKLVPSAADPDVSMSGLNEALSEVSNTGPEHENVEERSGAVSSSEAEQSVEAPKSEESGEPIQGERPSADHHSVAGERQEMPMESRTAPPNTAENLPPIDAGPRSAGNGEHNTPDDPPPSWDTPPIPSKCRRCKRWFPSNNALYRHREFYHDEVLIPAGTRNRTDEYYLYLQDREINPKDATKPSAGVGSSVQAPLEESNGIAVCDEESSARQEILISEQQGQHTKIKTEQPDTVTGLEQLSNTRRSPDAGGRHRRPDRTARVGSSSIPLQCRICERSFESKNGLYRHLISDHRMTHLRRTSRKDRGIKAEHHIKQEDTTDRPMHNQYRTSEARASNGPLTASRDFQNPMIQHA